MNEPNWKELEQLWQSTEATAPDIDLIAKQHRRRWASDLVFYTEMLIVVVGSIISLMVIPNAPLIGGAALIFCLSAGAASVWVRMAPRSTAPDDSVMRSLDTAIYRASLSVRWCLASFWVVVGCLIFMAAVALAVSTVPDFTIERTRHMLYALAFGMIWCAGGQVIAIIYYLKRSRELARLEEIKQSLTTE